ncbi:hypothetical protein B0H19DRAFT_951858, partial [Mycena capillaripes]
EKSQAVTKENFLAIYGRAHVRALTESNVKSAFAKTGLWPFSRDVVTAEMMAPSLETSVRDHLPVLPTTSVRVMTDMLYRARKGPKKRGWKRIQMMNQTGTTHQTRQPPK